MTASIISSPPPSGSLRLALAQFDFPVGDITGNRDKIINTIQRARDEFHADIVVFPELALSGPLPEDLLLCEEFVEGCEEALHNIAENTQGITAIVGLPKIRDNKFSINILENNMIYEKFFDEYDVENIEVQNYFFRGKERGILINLIVTDDSMIYHMYNRNYSGFLNKGLTLFFVSSSFRSEGLFYIRKEIYKFLKERKSRDSIAWLNTVGGHDSVVFDGGSLLVDADGTAHPPAASFEEHLLIADYDLSSHKFTPLYWPVDKESSEEYLIWKAITRGIADYCRKNGFDKVWLGLSGGIDSALVLALAVDALGADNVRAVSLPSRHTISLSNDLAAEQCRTLGVKLENIPIEPAYQGFLQALNGLFDGLPKDVTEENLQSRCRGTILMALTNKFGGLLLSTGNKSEYAVGYATIYGDMCGGYAPLKDLYKTQVYKLCRWRNENSGKEIIPLGVIERAPSAELRDNQRDQDSLPPYEILDDILYQYIELQESKQTIIEAGHDAETVTRVLHLLRSSEWKRHQGPPGPKLSRCAFGQDWHYPISNGWRDQS